MLIAKFDEALSTPAVHRFILERLDAREMVRSTERHEVILRHWHPQRVHGGIRVGRRRQPPDVEPDAV
jgi:hypothetical protein